MNKKKIVVIVVLVCVFALYMPTSSAQEKLIEYPVKRETMEELLRLLNKLEGLESDIMSLWQQDRVQGDSQALATLQTYHEKISEPIQVMLLLINLENKHNRYPYEFSALFYINEVIEVYLSNCDRWTKNIDSLMPLVNKFKSTIHSSIIVHLNKLKEYASESKMLMQKIIKELENTIKILETNE